ncbi:MAG: hypothetical protein LUG13_03050 [Oscillospiraceae bacterium]|nr:hypothetical protein [Oscillospiraceae bacterium]
MSADNTTGSTLAVIVGGTPVPLANNQILDGFTVNGANTVFTVPTTGKYLISYDINVTAGLLVSSAVYRNGVAIASSTISPIVSVSKYAATFLVNLTAGDTLQLTLFGLLATAVLQGGVGASMTVVELS